MHSQKVDISTSTLVRFILLLLGVWFIYLIRDIFALLFLVLIFVAGLSPTVDRWAKSITRPGAVISVFLLFFLAMGLVFSILLPPLVSQLQEFTFNLPTYTDQLNDDQGIIDRAGLLIAENLNSLSSRLSDLSGALFNQTLGVVNGLVAFITVLLLTFYLLLEEEGLKKIYKGLLPDGWYGSLAETTRKIAGKLGAWLRGQVVLMLAVGALVTLGLLLINLPYALVLGVWAAVTEVIPMVGPWLGAIPAVAIAFTISPLMGFLTLLIYILVQQIENSVLVPKIMGKAVGLNPVVVIIAILIGGKLYGLLGVLLAVPLAAVISVVAEDWSVIQQIFTRKTRET